MTTQSRIHPTAQVSPEARLGEGTEVGPFAIIHSGVELGDHTYIGPYCEIGVPVGGAHQPEGNSNGRLTIGRHSIIRSGSVIYTECQLGDRFECGHKVTIRERTRAGTNLRVGTLTDIQGDCILGEFVRVHGNVQIGKGSLIKNYVWIFPMVVLTNDPHPPSDHCLGVTIEDFAVIGAHSVVLPGVSIGTESVIGAGSVVKSNIGEGVLASGAPAKSVCLASNIRNKTNPAKKAYPWKDVFDRGLPWEGVGYAKWRAMNPDQGGNL